MCQMKEQDKTTEKQLNEMEIGNLPFHLVVFLWFYLVLSSGT